MVFGGQNVSKESDNYSLALEDGKKSTISAKLFYDAALHTEAEIEFGNVSGNEARVGEKAKRWIWASEDMNVVTVSTGSNGECEVTAKGAGTTYVTVTIETVNGNTYTARIRLTVS